MCYQCGATFYHESAYHVHMGKDHPDDTHPTQWATGTRCLTCSREYHDAARLIKHLYATRSCADPWRAHAGIASEEQAAATRAAVLEVQRRNIKDGLPPNYAHVPSYKTDVQPTYAKSFEYHHPTTRPTTSKDSSHHQPGSLSTRTYTLMS